MTTTYRLHVNDLSVELINTIKAAFKDKTVDIIVTDKLDATDHEAIRKYMADEDSFPFWMLEEEDLYEDIKRKNRNEYRRYCIDTVPIF